MYVAIRFPRNGRMRTIVTLTSILTKLFTQAYDRNRDGWEDGCNLTGISLKNDHYLRNLGQLLRHWDPRWSF